jgi:hypothetical protein
MAAKSGLTTSTGVAERLAETLLIVADGGEVAGVDNDENI